MRVARSYKPIEAHYTPPHAKILKTIYGKVDLNYTFNKEILRDLRYSSTGFLREEDTEAIDNVCIQVPPIKLDAEGTSRASSFHLRGPSETGIRELSDIFTLPPEQNAVQVPRTPSQKREFDGQQSELKLSTSSKRRRLGFDQTDNTWPDIEPFAVTSHKREDLVGHILRTPKKSISHVKAEVN